MAGFQTLFDPSQENLEQRLAEAEAYQKILEQQIKVLLITYLWLKNDSCWVLKSQMYLIWQQQACQLFLQQRQQIKLVQHRS